jgi:hypothetical protein
MRASGGKKKIHWEGVRGGKKLLARVRSIEKKTPQPSSPNLPLAHSTFVFLIRSFLSFFLSFFF